MFIGSYLDQRPAESKIFNPNPKNFLISITRPEPEKNFFRAQTRPKLEKIFYFTILALKISISYKDIFCMNQIFFQTWIKQV